MLQFLVEHPIIEPAFACALVALVYAYASGRSLRTQITELALPLGLGIFMATPVAHFTQQHFLPKTDKNTIATLLLGLLTACLIWGNKIITIYKHIRQAHKGDS